MLVCLLAVNYNVTCTKGRTIKLIIWTWAVNILISLVTTSVVYSHGCRNVNKNVYTVMFTYIPDFISATFSIFAFIAYIVMFVEFASSTRRLNCYKGQRTSLFSIFRHSRFFVSILLVSSCLIFNVIPRIVYSIYLGTVKSGFGMFVVAVSLSITFSDFCDSVIYVFLQKSVRRELSRVCRIFRGRGAVVDVSNDGSLENNRGIAATVK